MDGIYGWLGPVNAPQDVLQTMARATNQVEHGRPVAIATADSGLGGQSRFRKLAVGVDGAASALLFGRPQFLDRELAATATAHGMPQALLHGWRKFGTRLPVLLSGSFAFVLLDSARGELLAAIDRMGIERLCYAHRGTTLVFGTSAEGLMGHPAVSRTLEPQALFDFLYFHVIPSPRTIYRGVTKLLPGEALTFHQGVLRVSRYWRADYTPATVSDYGELRREFRGILTDAVATASGAESATAFLSGGTDSSTVVGILTEVKGGAVDAFSIGFAAEGYDEMEYARCAATQFSTRLHEHYLTPDNIVEAVPLIASEYDEPFGNSSAVPTYFCAKAAAQAGFSRMLAGDGGDEIFGGNVRYAKQKQFEQYFLLPALLRHGVIEPIARLPGLSERLPLRKLKSYVTQANVRLPLRLETYNFLRRTSLAEIFTEDFIATIDTGAPDKALSGIYAQTSAEHYVNRLMDIDLKFVLADNDLRKVGLMTEAAGIEVAYPLLDDRLVEFANRLPVNYKVRGLKLRWFFKAALDDVLPEKIIKKSKHGFGLPFGVWATTHAGLRELVNDSLADFGRRGIIKASYLSELVRLQHSSHAGYYGVMVWVVMMLEQWLRAHRH